MQSNRHAVPIRTPTLT